MRLGILVSGRGSNLEAVLDAARDGVLLGVEPVLVISNRAGVRALEVAASHGVPAAVLRRADFPEAGARDAMIGAALRRRAVQLALLAGYDELLRPPYFDAFDGPTINIHPSLLPRHGGAGMVGGAVHEAVIGAGDLETGVTIHQVTPELDAGPILAVERVAVEPDDDAATLAARVLGVEHRLLVETLARLVAQGWSGMASATMTARARP